MSFSPALSLSPCLCFSSFFLRAWLPYLGVRARPPFRAACAPLVGREAGGQLVLHRREKLTRAPARATASLYAQSPPSVPRLLA